MALKLLSKSYVQKSRIFLYPALDIKRGSPVVPIQTHVIWKGFYDVNDAKLCSLYNLKNDIEFREFEKSKLLGNKLYHDFRQVEDNKGIYVFDFSQNMDDWECFIDGKYSQFSEVHKKKVLAFFGNKSPNYAYIESYLYPEKYYRMYAEMMGIHEKHLKAVGQLCSKPDLTQETLEMSIINLDIINKIP